MLSAILQTPVPAIGRSKALAPLDIPAEGDIVLVEPTWPTCPPERRLQRWQFSTDFLSSLAGNSDDIVPVDQATSFADVQLLDWYISHPSHALGSDHKRKLDDERDRSRSVDIDGFDDEERPRSSSCSASPVKRAKGSSYSTRILSSIKETEAEEDNID
jgi:hypothetical protein